MRPLIQRSLAALAASAAFIAAGPARAELHIGVILSLTGPAASLGIPAENSVKLWPAEIGGQKVKVTVLNDNSDPTTAAKNATKLITEDNVDVIVGPSVTPCPRASDASSRARPKKMPPPMMRMRMVHSFSSRHCGRVSLSADRAVLG